MVRHFSAQEIWLACNSGRVATPEIVCEGSSGLTAGVEWNLADWAEIVREHGQMAFNTAWRILGHVADTEDVVQESLLEAFRLQRDRSVRNWGGLLRQLATRRALDQLRKLRHREAPLPDTALAKTPQPDALAIERELAARLRAAIAELPEREATVFTWHSFAHMSNPEIASTLGISGEAVAVALHRARNKLRELLNVNPIRSRETKP
jgi:RNA polymerase sigma-70 factor (ECF subfamily)